MRSPQKTSQTSEKEIRERIETKESSHSCVAVIGGGSWATAIVKILSEQPHIKIRWWLRKEEDVKHIRKYHHNPRYLSDVQVNPRKVRPHHRINKVVKDADTVILAVPAAFVGEALSGLDADSLKGKLLVSAIKGMMPNDNLLISDALEQHFGISPSDICVIAGPCHAEEVALEKRSYLTIGCKDAGNAEKFSALMSCRFVSARPIADIYGVEYCAVIKNIIAIACGIAHGLNYGDNFQSVLVANAMQEIKRFLDLIDPRERDLNMSAYLGDLLVTTYSQFSRNRTFGNMVGRGYSVKSAQMEMNMIAEGYYAVKSIHAINQEVKADMPITSSVHSILYDKVSPAIEFRLLADRMG